MAHRRNPLPKTPPKRSYGLQRPARAGGSSSLDRTRHMMREHEKSARPFDPSKRGSWQGSGRDLVVNGKPKIKSGYAYQLADVGDFSSWKDAVDDDWETVMFTPRGGERFVGYRMIDGSRCAVFESGDKTVVYAQLAHMTRNAGARDDVPEHLKAIRFQYRSDGAPTENGESRPYNSWGAGTDDDGDQWYLVEYASGSDYSGGLVYRSNFLQLEEMLLEVAPLGESPAIWAHTHGGHSTYGILVVWDKLPDEIVETLNALEDYPLISEDAHSELVMEMENESWENWVKSDLEKAFIKELNSELDGGEVEEWPDGVDSYPLFRMAMESSNSEWVEEDSAMGSGLYVDLKRVVPDAVALVLESKPVSKYISADDVEYLAELDKALGLEKK